MPMGMPCMGGAMSGMMPMAMPGSMMMPNMMMPNMMMPNMMNMMANMAAMASGNSQSSSSSQPPSSHAALDGVHIDHQVRALCKDFSIEDRLMKKLNTAMLRRPESFDDDVQTLRDRLNEPRADVGVLITQIERG